MCTCLHVHVHQQISVRTVQLALSSYQAVQAAISNKTLPQQHLCIIFLSLIPYTYCGSGSWAAGGPWAASLGVWRIDRANCHITHNYTGISSVYMQLQCASTCGKSFATMLWSIGQATVSVQLSASENLQTIMKEKTEKT